MDYIEGRAIKRSGDCHGLHGGVAAQEDRDVTHDVRDVVADQDEVTAT
jgi:hypothetical protein